MRITQRGFSLLEMLIAM
ncbi:prepilin-type N-terminal cleavage/methylation domain-containing protein, partial [Pantoea endophytica]